MTSAETRTTASGIEELEGEAAARGQCAVEPVPAPGRIADEPDAQAAPAAAARRRRRAAVEPTRTCGQDGAPAGPRGQGEPAGRGGACGQDAVEPTRTCGQEEPIDPAGTGPALTCGQEEPAGRGGACGQDAVEPAKTCGQEGEPVNPVGTGPAQACGQELAPAGTGGQHKPPDGRGAACGQEEPGGPLSPANPVSPVGAEPAKTCGQEEGPVNAVDPVGSEPASTRGGQAAQHRRLDQLEMDSWRAFLAASTSVTARLNHELEAGCGISMHEYEILVRLSEAPGRSMRMSTLAEHVSHSRSRLTHTVGRLEKEGYVMRVSCSSDKRGVNCELTEAGLAFLRRAAPVHLDGVRRHVVDRLSRDQLGLLSELMRAISEAPDTQAA